jgi:hypothetical protein
MDGMHPYADTHLIRSYTLRLSSCAAADESRSARTQTHAQAFKRNSAPSSLSQEKFEAVYGKCEWIRRVACNARYLLVSAMTTAGVL